jgi:hypothetical protein
MIPPSTSGRNVPSFVPLNSIVMTYIFLGEDGDDDGRDDDDGVVDG